MPSSVDSLYKLTLSIMRRDVNCIKVQSFEGRLPTSSARTLVYYMKLLKELQELELKLKAQRAAEEERAVKAEKDEALLDALKD